VKNVIIENTPLTEFIARHQVGQMLVWKPTYAEKNDRIFKDR
jgi:hypothetical protein